jgi:Gpi18-like mannosyltransferase
MTSLPLLVYGVTSAIVIVCVIFGARYLKTSDRWDAAQCFARYDGQHYRYILEHGYTNSTASASNVAFFPLYPLLARAVALTIRVSSLQALLLVTHNALAAAFVLLWLYRYPVGESVRTSQEESQRPGSVAETNCTKRARNFAVLAFGLLPTTVFFRMAYTEALFVALSIAVLYGIVRRWPLAWLALLAGLATATRPVGVALVPPLLW